MIHSRRDGYRRGRGNVRERVARAIFGVLLWSALAGGSAALPAQVAKPPEKPAPAVKTHDPLEGKACVECHRRVASPEVKCLLAKEDLCEFCHEIPAEGGPARLVKTPEPLCARCHRKDQFKGNFAHGPYAAGACVNCHDPHGGNVPVMLRVVGSQMCLECHEDMSARLANGKFRHKVAGSGCLECHAPHMSDQRSLLTSAVPGPCKKCHESILRGPEKVTVKHSPVTEESSCMNCHDPHAADRSGLLSADGLDICLKCHDEPVKTEKQEFADMKQLLASNPYPHGPIQSRDCSACHDAHNSSYYRLLKYQYPQDFYVPFFVSNYDLCFRCHDSALATDESTTRTTEFRDGDRNLHFVHVNRTSHGRTCRSCHEVHASSLPKHIGVTVPFGNWKLPVKFEKTESGGSCTPGCHAVQKYDRQAAKGGQP